LDFAFVYQEHQYNSVAFQFSTNCHSTELPYLPEIE